MNTTTLFGNTASPGFGLAAGPAASPAFGAKVGTAVDPTVGPAVDATLAPTAGATPNPSASTTPNPSAGSAAPCWSGAIDHAGAIAAAMTQLAATAADAARWPVEERRGVLEHLDRSIDGLTAVRATVLVAERESEAWRTSGDRSFEAWRGRTSRSATRSCSPGSGSGRSAPLPSASSRRWAGW